jgi:OPT family oligopeptide transporter
VSRSKRERQMPSSTKPASAAEEAMGGKAAQQGGEGERYPVEEVALVVPETDDPSTPVMTFRAWTLGLTSCVVLIFLNTFFTYRTQPLTISGILAQILVLPVGRFMASVLPDREVKLLGGRLGSFNLNPGPFNIKEHVIITIFANCGVSFGGGDAYSIGAITVMKAYYKQTLSFVCALLLVLTTQVRWLLCILIIRAWLLAPFTIYF